MRVLLINKFLYPKGGDALCTLRTGELLKKKGHDVAYWGMEHPDNPSYPFNEFFVSYIDYNKRLHLRDKIYTSMHILYSFEAKKKLSRLLKKFKPTIVHLHNFAHQISPSIIHLLDAQGIPMIMTMHDFKLVCATYRMLLKNRPCERCRNKKYYYCTLHKCTKNSLLRSFINTLEMYLHHGILNIYKKVSLFISPSRFMIKKMKQMGFPYQMEYLPNFVSEVNQKKEMGGKKENTVVYAGRLAIEKGLFILIDAIKGTDAHLNIIGDGPLYSPIKKIIRKENIKNVILSGFMKQQDVYKELCRSHCGVLPSIWYENNPRFILEAFSAGTPVIGSRIGGIPELIKDTITGFTFTPGDTTDLREKISQLLLNKDKAVKMGINAQRMVKEEYNPDKYYKTLISLYKRVIDRKK